MSEAMNGTAKQVAEYIIAHPGCDRRDLRYLVGTNDGTIMSALKTVTYWYYLWEEDVPETKVWKNGKICTRTITRYHIDGEQFEKSCVFFLDGVSNGAETEIDSYLQDTGGQEWN